ncbi:MAG: pilus assembly protein [Pseudomonadota bacterium]
MSNLNIIAGASAAFTAAKPSLPVMPCLSRLTMLATLLALTACAQTTPRADATFGDTVRIATARQTMYPDAAQNIDPVSGMDGRAARDALDRYHKSFKEPTPHPSVFTIGVGGG